MPRQPRAARRAVVIMMIASVDTGADTSKPCYGLTKLEAKTRAATAARRQARCGDDDCECRHKHDHIQTILWFSECEGTLFFLRVRISVFVMMRCRASR